MDRFEVTRMIRFGIEELSARNGHHEFEEMCRALVSQRIASNVYPSTGPVSAGGDQGRDFQTFATHIQEELGPHGGFAALASNERIAFACTLQKSGLEAKILSDVAKISAGTPAVSKVYALLGADLAAGKSNGLKGKAAEQGVELEILDGHALAEMLSDPETFWIAARWLGLPSEVAPSPPEAEVEAPEWYSETRDRWRDAEHAPQTMGELMDLREALRRSVFHRDARPDLPLWLGWMDRAATEAESEYVRQRAQYEASVGHLRGAGDLRPVDGIARDHIEGIDPGAASWGELRDAGILVSYVAGAVMRAHTDITAEWTLSENQRLRDGIEARLDTDETTTTERVGLLDVLGHLRAQPDLDEFEMPEEPGDRRDPIEEPEPEDAPPPQSWIPLIDRRGAIGAWTELARLAPQAPLVPIDSLSRVVAFMTPALVDDPGFRELIELLDALQAEVGGNAAAAARSRDRAMALIKDGRPLDALVDMHDAKARWWQGDTLRGTLLALMMLTRCYEELGLLMAARQQALQAVILAFHYGEPTDRDIVVTGLMKVGHLDYLAGAWCSAVESYNVALLAHLNESEDPWNMKRHDDLAAVAAHGAYMRAAAKILGSAVESAVRKSQDEFGIGEFIDGLEDLQTTKDPAQWRDDCAQIEAVPFADAGDIRKIKWSALGVDWEITASNTYSHCRAAERFAAAAQILCAELATSDDLILLPTTIRVRVQAVDPDRSGAKGRIRTEPGNRGSDWVIDLIPLVGDGSELDPDEVSSELTGALAAVLFEASLVDWDTYMAVLKGCFERGLGHKIGGARPYDALAGVVNREHFERLDRRSILLPEEWQEPPVPQPAEALRARTDPGPGYSEKQSKKMIANRYQRSEEILCKTLPRLAGDEDFDATYRQLKATGWLDWHVLLALVNARINFRTEVEELDFEEARAQREREPQHPVESDEEPPLPAEWLSVEKLSEMRRFAFMSGLSNWDLEIHQQTPDLEAAEILLGRRYGYWQDDVDHRQWFGQ